MADQSSCCSYQVILMKHITLWPLETPTKLKNFLQTLFRYIMMVTLLFGTLSLTGATLFSDDLKELSSTVDILTLTASSLYKLVFMSLHMARVQQLVHSMNRKFKRVIYNKNGNWSSIKQESERCNLYSTSLIMGGVITMIFFSVAPLLEEAKFESVLRGNTTIRREVKRYPLHFWLPFNTDSSPWYEFVYTLQSCSLLFAALIYLVNDSFLFMIIYQISIQMRMLYLLIVNLDQGIMDYNDSNLLPNLDRCEMNVTQQRTKETSVEKIEHEKMETLSEDQIEVKLKRCITFHSHLLEMIVEIEDLYRSMILADVLHAIISLSFALHDTGVSDSIYERITMYMFLFVCITHQFLNSHFGEIFLTAQEKITEAIYMSEWINRDIRYKKYLIIMMIRSKRHTILNGGKLYNLCRPSFVLFIKTMFSYYMVIRQSSE